MKRGRGAIEAAPERLVRAAPASPLAQMVIEAKAQPPLSDVTLARVLRRIPRGRSAPLRHKRYGLKAATVALVLALGIGVGVAATLVSVALSPRRQPAGGATGSTSPSGPRRSSHSRIARPEVVALAPVAVPEAPPVAPAVPAEPAAPPARRPRIAPVAVPAAAAVVSDEPLAPGPVDASPAAAESALVAEALRLAGNPTTRDTGLLQLRSYLDRVPDGRFRDDVEVALASGLVNAGRSVEARRLVDAIIVRDGSRARLPLQLLAAELALPTRCAEALKRLEALVPSLRDNALLVRALYDRGVARLRCGDVGAGRADLEQVIRRDPSGARAAAASTELLR